MIKTSNFKFFKIFYTISAKRGADGGCMPMHASLAEKSMVCQMSDLTVFLFLSQPNCATNKRASLAFCVTFSNLLKFLIIFAWKY